MRFVVKTMGSWLQRPLPGRDGTNEIPAAALGCRDRGGRVSGWLRLGLAILARQPGYAARSGLPVQDTLGHRAVQTGDGRLIAGLGPFGVLRFLAGEDLLDDRVDGRLEAAVSLAPLLALLLPLQGRWVVGHAS